MGDQNKAVLLECVRVMLRPVVRLCLRRYVRLQDFIEMAKVVFIDIATEELEKQGDSLSASRLAVASGVHRKDITRIQAEGAPARLGANLITRVIAHWGSDKRFTTTSGAPRVLEPEGKGSEFAKLVRSVSSELSPYSVLYELQRMGAVERTPKGLQLCPELPLPKASYQEGLGMLARDTEDFVEAVCENLSELDEIPNLHLRTEYDNIRADAALVIREWFIREGSAFHRRAREFLSQYDNDITPSSESDSSAPERIRVMLGAFSHMSDPEKVRGNQEARN